MSGLVALTGATGFVGAALLKTLTSRGWRVRALTRRPRPNTPEQDKPETQWINGALDDGCALRALVEDAAALIHCAGVVRGRNAAEFNHANVQGTANLLRAIKQNGGTARFLLISSLAARHPQYSWYAASKYQAEQILSQQDSLPWTIFRPTALYGPGDKEIKPMLRAMRAGVLITPGRSTQRISLLHIDDLGGAVLRWLQHPEHIPGTFELDDGQAGGYSWEMLAEIAEHLWQRRVYRIAVPLKLMKALAHLNLLSAHLLGYAPMLTPGKINEITHPDWRCDNRPLMQALGWRPQVKLPDAMRQACL